ncbi:hypothetical protein H6P81_008469 [Aristolochia fimbriata]|uniref:Uncharacterized protein n=1 Tax=Aristolochia fimbriata TaxID=158543 RepID=A0AAV7EIS2_ARIFI|nr:hypothetical protein H6P81_008469 [Aristolochia fimbriata]
MEGEQCYDTLRESGVHLVHPALPGGVPSSTQAAAAAALLSPASLMMGVGAVKTDTARRTAGVLPGSNRRRRCGSERSWERRPRPLIGYSGLI